MFRCSALVVVAAALVGCSALAVVPGEAPAPVSIEPRAVLHVHGSGDFQTFVGVAPFSAAVRWAGNGTIEVRGTPTGVVVYASGDSTWTVTPIPGLEAQAARAVADGSIVIMRNGVRAGLSAPMAVPMSPAPPAGGAE
jgi:hypothetical protein